MLKKFSFCALAAAAMLTATTLSAKELRVATNPTFAPFEFVNSQTKEITGFEMNLIRAMGKKAGYDVVIQSIDFDGIIPAVMSGNVDVGASGFLINDKRKEKVNFLNPFYKSGFTILVHKSQADKIKSFDDLKGKKIAVQLGSISADKAKEVPDAQIKTFNHSGEAILELANGGVDAMINSNPATEYMLQVQPKIAETTVLVPGWLTSAPVGQIVNKKNTALQAELNAALDALKKDGEYAAIYKKWFGSEPDFAALGI